MSEKQRYSRLSDIIKLMILMQSRTNGVTIQDIQDEFGISRRTAERMRDGLIKIIPNIKMLQSHDKIKRWGFTNFSFKDIIYFSDYDIEILQNLKNKNKDAKILNNIINKIKILHDTQDCSAKDELEFLFLSEKIGIRELSKYNINLNIFSIIREGIKKRLEISLIYDGRQRLIEPLGVSFGEKTKLFARDIKNGDDVNIFYFHKINSLSLTNNHFDFKNFNLKEYTENFSENKQKVELLFSEDMKDEIYHYNFSSKQKIKQLNNKNFKVSFRTETDEQFLHELFKWGNKVKILSPKTLKENYKNYLTDVLKNL